MGGKWPVPFYSNWETTEKGNQGSSQSDHHLRRLLASNYWLSALTPKTAFSSIAPLEYRKKVVVDYEN